MDGTASCSQKELMNKSSVVDRTGYIDGYAARAALHYFSTSTRDIQGG